MFRKCFHTFDELEGNSVKYCSLKNSINRAAARGTGSSVPEDLPGWFHSSDLWDVETGQHNLWAARYSKQLFVQITGKQVLRYRTENQRQRLELAKLC